jgi:thiamine pyrophosphate-dependent acetolactate synthase large subunit-like protein
MRKDEPTVRPEDRKPRSGDPDLAAIARSLGLVGHGPVREAGDLRRILKQAISETEGGSAVVVDVHVGKEDYT